MKLFNSLNMRGNHILDCPDTEINEQKPTYTEAVKLENISSGETVKVAFGKLKKAISVLITHYAQKATASILGHVKLSNSAAITTAGEYALDAIEKNASVNGTLANQIASVNGNLSAKANKSEIPYGFRNFTQSRWTETTDKIDDLPDGLSVRGYPTEEYNFSDTWYYFTFYEGGNNDKSYGIQFAFARQATVLIMRYKQGGHWDGWQTISSNA